MPTFQPGGRRLGGCAGRGYPARPAGPTRRGRQAVGPSESESFPKMLCAASAGPAAAGARLAALQPLPPPGLLGPPGPPGAPGPLGFGQSFPRKVHSQKEAAPTPARSLPRRPRAKALADSSCPLLHPKNCRCTDLKRDLDKSYSVLVTWGRADPKIIDMGSSRQGLGRPARHARPYVRPRVAYTPRGGRGWRRKWSHSQNFARLRTGDGQAASANSLLSQCSPEFQS